MRYHLVPGQANQLCVSSTDASTLLYYFKFKTRHFLSNTLYHVLSTSRAMVSSPRFPMYFTSCNSFQHGINPISGLLVHTTTPSFPFPFPLYRATALVVMAAPTRLVHVFSAPPAVFFKDFFRLFSCQLFFIFFSCPSFSRLLFLFCVSHRIIYQFSSIIVVNAQV